MQSFLTIVFRALAAGVLSTIVTLVLGYLIGVVLTLISLREISATLLVAFTVLPLMLLFVMLPITLAISAGIAISLALTSYFRKQPAGVLVGMLAGLLLSELLLTVIVPLMMGSHPGDFISIVRNPFVSGCYGIILGGTTGLGFHRFAST